MAKKKKHRKTRKQKLVRKNVLTQQNNTNLDISATDQQSIKTKETLTTNNHEQKVKSVPTTKQDESLMYVKHDIKRSLMLVGIILFVFVVFYLVLEKTPIGPQVYSLIKS